MASKSIIVGTAGHIDHGKTTLIKALTGVNTDRLKEEQQRGITIELGFAPFNIEDVHVGFVDVPGHEKFVKHMLSGAGGINAMLLVVAADESIMPQTREHVEICRLLAIQKAIVAITKTELVDDETIELVTLETTELLEENGFHNVPIIPVSAKSKIGLDILTQSLHDIAKDVPPPSLHLIPRLPIDRVFSLKGFGTVVTGTLVSGMLERGSVVELLPSKLSSQVKSIQVHGESVDSAMAGHRVAVNLPGITTEQIERGDLLSLKSQIEPTGMLDISLDVLPSSPCSLEQNQRVRLHIGSAEVLGRIALFSRNSIQPGENGFVRIRLEKPVPALIGDRFVLRRYSPMITIAGGEVLDNQPITKNEKKNQKAILLEKISKTDRVSRISLLLEYYQSIVGPQWLTNRFGLNNEESLSILKSLVESKELEQISRNPPLYCKPELILTAKNSLIKTLENYHQANPLQESVGKNILKRSLNVTDSEKLFKYIIDSLESTNSIEQLGAQVKLSSHYVKLNDSQKEIYDSIENQFRSAEFSPPAPTSVIKNFSHHDAQSLLDLLISRGILEKIDSDYFLHKDNIETMLAQVRKRAGENFFTVSEFKEWFGLSRKYAIPLLEYLDNKGVTYRDGDSRKLL